MSYCHDQGIPHSEFLAWDEVDRAKLIAYLLEKAERCQMCGTAPWEWAENRFAYEPARHVCFGCQKKDLMREDDDGSQAGVSIVLLPEAVARQRREQQQEA